ncbi:hypothetical protein [Phenylobacterium sp.]|uniref:hypothetical protein n=1 Tax=Phenylobacterium sp. TaxID=1871053 RepID=UPI0035B3304A
MPKVQDDWPEWLREQVGLRYAEVRHDPRLAARFMSKGDIVREYARHLQEVRGEPVTYPKIKAMLEALDRGYADKTDQLSFALYRHRHWSKRFRLDPFPNGQAVSIEGRSYRSIREAAKGEGVSPETVRRRIRAKRPGWSYWEGTASGPAR